MKRILFILLIGLVLGCAGELNLISNPDIEATVDARVEQKLKENNEDILLIPIPTSEPTPTPITTSESIEELKEFALELINTDREKHGVLPVVMGNNNAAQLHADESLEHRYNGHWFISGEKPYMVYSNNGGDSYISENSASGGWNLEEEERCRLDFSRNCITRTPKYLIESQHNAMMYDDAHSNWGHRDNIINPYHLKVNIGIAFDKSHYFTAFYQHFEGGHFIGEELPKLNGSELKFKIKNVTNEFKFSDSNISIFYDPLPLKISPEKINSFSSYCLGGGLKCYLEQELRISAYVLEPLGPGYFYPDLKPKDKVAHTWVQNNDSLIVGVNLEDAVNKKGIYTIVIWGQHLKSGDHIDLIELSFVKN